MCDQDKALAAGVALLERAIDYALGSLRVITPATLCRPTPCTGWNLQHLLDHMADSLQTLNDAASGHIPLAPRRTPFIPIPTPRPPSLRKPLTPIAQSQTIPTPTDGSGAPPRRTLPGPVAPAAGATAGSPPCSSTRSSAASASDGGDVGSGFRGSAVSASGGSSSCCSCACGAVASAPGGGEVGSGFRRSAVPVSGGVDGCSCSCACGAAESASGGGVVGSGFRRSAVPVSGGVDGCSCSCACGAAEPASGGGDVGSGLCRSAALASGGVDGLSSCSDIRRSAVSALLLRDRATEVLGVWVGAVNHPEMVSIGDRHLTAPMVAAAGAIEIAVHGWDVARACGEQHPIPALMAEELLDLAHLFVTDVDRPHRFAQPRTLPSRSSAQDYLLAYLGRDPNWPTAL